MTPPRRPVVGRREALRLGAALAAAAGGDAALACTPLTGPKIAKMGEALRDMALPVVQGAGRAGGLTLQQTVVTGQGNAAGAAWNDDGTTLYLANSESDAMSALRIDADPPGHPRVTGRAGGPTYEAWAVAQEGGLLVFSTSLGNTTVSRIDPASWKILWATRMPSPGHALATDGANIFVPLESNPGRLVVLDARGATRGSVTVPGTDWSNGGRGQTIYGIVWNERLRLLAVSVYGVDKVFLFDASHGGAPALKGTFASAAGSLATAGTRMWTNPTGALQCWEISDPAAPRLVGTYTNTPIYDGQAGGNVVTTYGQLCANAAGTRVYATYSTANVGSHAGDPGRSAGIALFDVTRDTPVQLTADEWKLSERTSAVPLGLAVSPRGIAAVTYYNFGVRFHTVTDDAVAPVSSLPTAGESRDVYVDAAGYFYAFGDYMIAAYTPQGELLTTFYDGDYHEGGWIPFKDGLVLCPGGFAGNQGITGWALERGTIMRKSFFWDNETSFALAFDGTYVYQGGTTGVVVYAVGPAANGYPLTQVGGLALADVSGGAHGTLRAVALDGRTLWGTGDNCGVVAVDVSTPTAPRLLYQDKFSYAINGPHCGMAVARGHVYAGCAGASVRIYDASRMVPAGAIPGYFPCFLDTARSDLLIVSHYGDGIKYFTNEGAYVFDLRRNPSAPNLMASWPGRNSPNFRARFLRGTIVRCPLWGIERLSIDGYA